jgi:hypothetical protein
VGRAAGRHEERRPRRAQRRESEHGAVLPREAPEHGLQVEVAAGQEEQRAEQRHRHRARRERRRAAPCPRAQQQRAHQAEQRGERVEEPVLHGWLGFGRCCSPEIRPVGLFIRAGENVWVPVRSGWRGMAGKVIRGDDIFFLERRRWPVLKPHA